MIPNYSGNATLRSKKLKRCGFASLTVLVLCGPMMAQQDAGILRVFTEDASSALVAGAAVRVLGVDTNISFSQETNSQGYATFSPIPRGGYNVEVSKAGFRTVRVTGVGIDVNQNRLLRLTLDVASVSEAIEVTGQAAAIQTEDASLGQVVSGKMIVELPLAGRRYTDLTLLTPGASESSADPNLRGPGWLVVNGNSQIMNNFLLDGFDNNQNTQNIQGRSAQVVSPSPDTLSEFKVQTDNYSAEFGRAAGAVINASLKSGGNAYHGSAWWFNRNAGLAANQWENNWAGISKNDLKWNQTGGTFGGPIKKNSLFFFGDYEGFFSRVSNAPFVTVPSMAERSGDFSELTVPILDPTTGKQFEGNRIPASSFDPLAKKIMDEVYPKPNFVWPVAGVGGRPINNFTRQVPTTDDSHKFDVRVDDYWSAKNRFFARYSFSQDLLFKTPTMPGLADTGAQDGGRQYARNQAMGGSWTRLISPTMINEARFGFTQSAADFSHATAGAETGTAFGFKGIPTALDTVGGLPRITITSYQSIGVGNFRPQYHNPHSYQATDSVSIVKGSHTLKVGFDYRFKEDDWVDLQYRTVAYNFDQRFTNDGAADFLLGFAQSLGGSNFFAAAEAKANYSAYAQDDWKLRPNLTLNLGLRYEFTTPNWGRGAYPSVNYDFIAKQLVIADPAPLVFGGRRASNKYAQNPDRNNFGPRIGIAYQANKRLVVRSAFGVFYNGEDITGTTAGELLINAPNLYRVSLLRVGSGPPPILLSQTIPSDFLDPAKVASTNLSINTRWPDALSATVFQWNTAIQFAVSDSSTFELAYVGNKGRNLEANLTPSNTPYGTDGSVIANRRFQQFQTLSMRAPLAHSHYNGLQAKFERRFSKNWFNLTSYTYASGFAETSYFGSGGGGFQNLDFSGPIPLPIFEPAFNDQLTRHRLSVANVYKLPFGRGERFGSNLNRVVDFLFGGWQTQFILTGRSGLPVNVTIGTTGVDPTTGKSYTFFTSSGGGQIRPNRVGDANTSIDPRVDRFHFLNINAFSLQAINTPGNSARNVAWGPQFWNVDSGITKRFPITEQKYFDFRFEAFNLFNHVNFQPPPVTNWTAAGFGQITTSYPARQVQIAVRFAF